MLTMIMRGLLILILLGSTAVQAEKRTAIYIGWLGQDSVRMLLTRNLDNDSLQGMYFTYAEGESVKLSGTIKDDRFRLRGVNAKGKAVATVIGEWLDSAIAGICSLGPRKKENYAFQLTKEPPRMRILRKGPDGKQIFGPVEFRQEQYEHKSRKREYQMTLAFPVVTGENSDTYWAEMFNARMRAFAKERERAFPRLVPRKHVDGSSSNLTLTYTVQNDYRFLISIAFREETYTAGAPHPTASSHTFNFDVSKNAWIELSDLFKKNAPYLKRISAYCTKRLVEKLGDREEVRQGASPDHGNFQRFSCTKEGLLFHFDQYQVSSYAEGEHEVLIPYKELKDIIDPASPVVEFM